MPILYGMPTHEAWEVAKQGKYALGGCCISDESPKWHCQTCGNEFGKEMPSIEDLESPEPDGITPLKLEFYIGGFSGPNHSVKFENGILKYQFCQIPSYPEKEASVLPTNRKWLNFRKKLDAIDVWQWQSDYPNPGVCDSREGVKNGWVKPSRNTPNAPKTLVFSQKQKILEFRTKTT